MRGKVMLQGMQLHWGRGWVFPLCCLVPLIGALTAVALGLFPGWEYYLLWPPAHYVTCWSSGLPGTT